MTIKVTKIHYIGPKECPYRFGEGGPNLAEMKPVKLRRVAKALRIDGVEDDTKQPLLRKIIARLDSLGAEPNLENIL